MKPLLDGDELETRLRRIGAERYHSLHPFHALLHGGRLSRGQVQAWALNRYCYQAAIPRKDLTLMSRMTDRAMRREWLHRVIEHDGGDGNPGGLERWLILTDGLGLDRDDVTSLRLVLPATRFAVEAYVRFVGERSTLEGIASSLTELFAPAIHKERIAGMLANYDFIDDGVMQYFRRRLEEAPRDVGFALAYVKREARTPEQQQAVLDAVRFKCDVLWAQLDALHHAYVEPASPPPGAFVAEARS
ncbi:MAG: pyrroloquinoline-quinone synthase PqqC [Rhodospirillales bacterium]|nr:pyrroloquinoline-quinone synthase PqqC [Rhodospirillales bacterium]